VDKRHKLIRKSAVTHAAVVDNTVFEALLEPSNTSRNVDADRGYPSIEPDVMPKQAGWRVHIQRQGHARKVSPTLVATQPPYRHTACPHRAGVWHFGANGWKAGALHGHCLYDFCFAIFFLKESGLAPF
jgi:IS5 family transposase